MIIVPVLFGAITNTPIRDNAIPMRIHKQIGQQQHMMYVVDQLFIALFVFRFTSI